MKRHPNMVSVPKFSKCNKCGCEQVAWVKSAKSGKFYLAEAYKDGDFLLANPIDPHFKHCSADRATA